MANVTATGRVERVFYSSEKFSAGVLMTKDGDEVKIAGAMFIKEGDRIKVVGQKSRHEKYGDQIKVETFSFDTVLDSEALSQLMAKDKRFQGIGPSRAHKIAEALGDSFEEAIKNKKAEDIAEAAGVPVKVIVALKEVWFEHLELNRTMAAMSAWGVAPGSAKRLFDSYGASVVKIVEENPYWLIGRVRGFAFKSIDKIAVAAGVPKDNPHRLEECLKFVANELSNSGHTWSRLVEILDDAEILLALDTLDGRDLIMGAMDRLTASGSFVRYEGTGSVIYWPRWVFNAEVKVVKTIFNFGVQGSHKATAGINEAAAIAFEPRLNKKQVAAVVASADSRVSVVTGGAGSGKTFTIRTIAALHEEHGLSVALCAPTGKAARRMVESVGMPAQTIHMLLGPKEVGESQNGLKFGFEYGDDNKLDVDIVIVDEFSMVDVMLARSLFAAIDFSRTSLVMVGDHNQLPSVGPGALLRDLVARPGVYCWVTLLDHVVRQAGVLKENVSGILSGGVAKSIPHMSMDHGQEMISPWVVVSQLFDSARLRQFIGELFHRKLSEFFVETADGSIRDVDPVWDVQLLTPMHRGPVGTQELNKLLQSINQGSLGREVPQPAKANQRTPFMPDDKVVATKNDYQLGIMNGTIGRVKELGAKGKLVVDFFEDGVKELTREKAFTLNLAYAMTVHKSQGSEWPIVIYVAHKGHQIMFSRNLFYTGVSRARKSAVILGDTWAIDQCAKRLQADKRRTMLSLAPEHVSAILGDGCQELGFAEEIKEND